MHKDTKKHHLYLLAELVHFFLTTHLLYAFTFSLGGLTEPPEPPLDPPQFTHVYLFSASQLSVVLSLQKPGS